MAEDLLHDADVDALFEQESCGGVAGVVDACFPDSRGCEERAPVLPIVAGVEGLAGGGAEDQVPVFPGRARSQAVGVLAAAVGAKLGDQGFWQGKGEFRLALVRFGALAAGEVPAAAGAGPFHLGATVASFVAIWTAPVILEALIPGRMQSHVSTAEVPRGAARARGEDGAGDP